MFWVNHRSTTDAKHVRGPHAERLDRAIDRIYRRHLARRALLRRVRRVPASPRDHLTAPARRAGVCLIAAALIVACDRWPAWLA